MGHVCTVAVTHDLDTLHRQRAPRFQGMLHADAAKQLSYPNKAGPDIIHAWTTRENVRVMTEKLRASHPKAKVVVHLEDNEQQLLAVNLGLTQAKLDAASETELDALIPANLSHPRRSRDFLNSADGITIITEMLREFTPGSHPCHLLWPAADARYFYPQSLPWDFRHILDRTPGETVLFYHGNVHPANAAEMRELYAAVLLLNQEGTPTTLIRTGLDTVDFLGNLALQVAPHVLSLGQILHHEHLPNLMALADFFVQPGAPDAFNNYRFPSKLPEFFSIGRPVILPRANLGQLVEHGIDAYVLDRADAAGIAAAIVALRDDPGLTSRLAAGALKFAATHFSWRRSAETLAQFYSSILASSSHVRTTG